MYPTSSASNNRILIIDDNPAIHEDFAKVLGGPRREQPGLADAEAFLFGEAGSAISKIQFKLESAFQGKEGLEMVKAAVAAGTPYAIAFVDVRMPPGWDGIETISQLWEVDHHLQVVLCTAYSDYSWHEISERARRPENLLILKKPFDNIEVIQLAHALTNKWLVTSQVNAWVDHLDGIVTDRTQELQSVNLQLEDSVQEARRLAAAAHAANQAKSEFLTVVSHEMLTPMNGIIGLAEYLRGTTLTPDQNDCAKDILASGERMMRIIRQVLDFVDADNPQKSFSPASVDLRLLVADLVAEFAAAAAAKGLTLTAAPAPPGRAIVLADAVRVRNTLVTFLENAIRFTNQGRVSIEFGPIATVAGRPKLLRCAITDQGVGIPKEKKDFIFRPFTQADGSLTRGHDGLGLSLALARKWIESMGGQIGFESEPGRGSTFWILLPESGAGASALAA